MILPKNVLVVYKVSTQELYRGSKDPKVSKYLQAHPEEVVRLESSHVEQKKTLEAVLAGLTQLGVQHESRYRGELHKRDLTGFDLIVSVGGDGTLLEVSHYIDSVPILGVNSDTATSVGFFSAANRETFVDMFASLNMMPQTNIERLEVYVNGELQQDKALNEAIFGYPRPGPSFNFVLNADGVVSKHRPTYHIMISTPAGSTGGLYGINGPIIPLSDSRIVYTIHGGRNKDFICARDISVESLSTKAEIVLDGHYRITIGFHDIAQFKLGSPVTIIGDVAAKQRAFIDYHRANNLPLTVIGEEK